MSDKKTMNTSPFIETIKEYASSKDNAQKIKTNMKQNVLLLSHLLYYVSKHEKVFVCRFDLHFPKTMLNEKKVCVPVPEYIKNKYSTPEARHDLFTNTMQNFRRKLERSEQNKLHPCYLYAIEKSSENKNIENERDHYEHLHILLLLNGNRTQNIQNHLKALEKIWYKQLGIDYNLNRGLVQLPKRNNGEFYNGTMICRNSPAFLDEFVDVFRFSSYLIKKEQKDNVPFRKKLNTSQLKLEGNEKKIEKFTFDLLQSCLKDNTKDFYEKYITDDFFRKIFLWGTKSYNQEITPCSPINATTDIFSSTDNMNTFDNQVQSEQDTSLETKEVEITNISIAPQNRNTKANQEEVNFYDMFDTDSDNQETSSGNLPNNTTDRYENIEDIDNPFARNSFGTERKGLETNLKADFQNSYVEINQEKTSWDNQQKEIYAENELEEARQLAKGKEYITPNVFARMQHKNSFDFL